jgi:hypothetical protein
MMDLQIFDFDRELLKDFIYNGVERDFSGEQITPIVEFYAKMGRCYIGKVGDKVLGVGGIYPLWPSAGGCFLFVNKEIQAYKKSIFKVLLEYSKKLIDYYEIKTLIVECNDDSLQSQTLINHLGFKKSSETKMSVFIKGA